MRLFVLIAVVFYVLIISLVGFSGLLFLTHAVSLQSHLDFFAFLYNDSQANNIAIFVVSATMMISLIYARIIYGRQQRERNIFINNPLGRVTISVSALEDLIRRMTIHTPQIKEIRPDITSTKRGLNIVIKLVLRSETNIPDLTATLQDMIKNKIHSVIGADERVIIRVHVIKISADPLKPGKSGRGRYEDLGDVTVPFPGYKA